MVRRRSRKQVAGQYALAAFLALVVIWLLFLVWGIARKEEIARSAVNDRKDELKTLEARKQVLSDNLAELDTPRGHEASLRQTYGVARPGEEVIIVVAPDEKPPEPKLPWYRKLLGWFGIW